MADLQKIGCVIISKYLHRYIKKTNKQTTTPRKTVVTVLG